MHPQLLASHSHVIRFASNSAYHGAIHGPALKSLTSLSNVRLMAEHPPVFLLLLYQRENRHWVVRLGLNFKVCTAAIHFAGEPLYQIWTKLAPDDLGATY